MVLGLGFWGCIKFLNNIRILGDGSGRVKFFVLNRMLPIGNIFARTWPE